MKILVIEDEPKVAEMIKSGLSEHDYSVDIAEDGLMGKEMAINKEYDLIILDLILPHLGGMEVCRAVKIKKPSLPIIMLTALGTTEDKLLGFETGADDYMVKPFEFRELLARIKAQLKRGNSPSPGATLLVLGNLELNLNKKIATRGSTRIELTAKEFALLEFFMRNKGRVISRLEISEKVWDVNFDTGTNVVDVYVNILRKKIDKDFENKLIHTRIGMGYIFGEK